MVLSRIELFPIKSLDGVSVVAARINSAGILEHDRVYAIVDATGSYVNGKRTDRVHLIRTTLRGRLSRGCLLGPRGNASTNLRPGRAWWN